ncbi:hypothetical protein BDK51DRAFT_34012 [Blyttiomyces helicus]|uniref:Uncharacterized protein n=1 Tax=Blyttiomyces helicus TaxID=388810 RepID=A0A4P9W7P6_9FUNG|nr:hypothetical protein BDK51DRAFT_34012 [Blyttiomyces helicus]|eukprot:RKO87405.1 hypothetical protein BDK51DRAFT_34012 [Blyttiomyces helicus]
MQAERFESSGRGCGEGTIESWITLLSSLSTGYCNPKYDEEFTSLFEDEACMISVIVTLLKIEVSEIRHVRWIAMHSPPPIHDPTAPGTPNGGARSLNFSGMPSEPVVDQFLFQDNVNVGLLPGLGVICSDITTVTKEGKTIGVEMQRSAQHFFLHQLKEAAALTRLDGGWTGGPEGGGGVVWTYELKPVYIIASGEFPVSMMGGIPVLIRNTDMRSTSPGATFQFCAVPLSNSVLSSALVKPLQKSLHFVVMSDQDRALYDANECATKDEAARLEAAQAAGEARGREGLGKGWIPGGDLLPCLTHTSHTPMELSSHHD